MSIRMRIARKTPIGPLLAGSMLVFLTFVGADASASHGSLSLVEPSVMYYACNFTLQVGNQVDYSYSATNTVQFEVVYAPPAPAHATPAQLAAMAVVKTSQEGTSSHGTLTADAAGVYTFWFYNPNSTTKSPEVVTYEINPHESWLAEWGVAVGLISVVAIGLVAAGIGVIVKARRKLV